MNKDEIVNKVKSLFSKEENFQDLKTIEGRILRIDSLELEQPILEVTEEGVITLEDGIYELEDGMLIEVLEGILKSFPEKEDEIENETETEVEVETEMEVEVETEVEIEMEVEEEIEVEEVIEEEVIINYTSVEEFNKVKENFESELNGLKSLVETLTNELSKINQLEELVNTFAKTPSTQPLKTKNDFKSLTKEDKLKQYRR